MIYDEKISESISLSKILDCFIIEREEPDVIFNFLKQYETFEIIEIIQYSNYSVRIFQLDFVSRLNNIQLKEFLEIIGRILEYSKITSSYNMIMTMLLQIQYSNIDESVKREYFELYKKHIKGNSCCYIENEIGFHHPYVGISGKIAKTYDMVFEDINTSLEESFEKIARLPIDKFQSYIINISSSLWGMRMVQVDFFEQLPVEKQFVFVRIVCNNIRKFQDNSHILEIFFKQIFPSEVGIEIKKLIYEMLNNLHNFQLSTVPGEIKDMFKEYESYEEIMFRANLLGLENSISDIIFYALMIRNEKFLTEMFKDDKELIENNFNICDLVETFNKENE